MGEGFVSVRVVAVHVECGRCGDRQRIQNDHEDGFTRHLLQPVGSWWAAHQAPQLLLVEVMADGEHQEWAAT